VYGNKAMRRIDLGFGNETLSASGTGYFWRDRERPESVSLLSEVFARPEKGRQAGEEMPALRTDTGKPFCGDIIFSTAATIEEH